MKLELVFLTASAIGLVLATGAAQAAGGNSAFLTQTGDANTAGISQSDLLGGNSAGTVSDAMVQNGDHNTLSLVQDTQSSIGVPQGYSGSYYMAPTYAPSGYGLGVDQVGDLNVINDTQTLGRVLQIQQNSPASGLTGTANSVTIHQTSNFLTSGGEKGAFIGSIVQTYGGSSGGADANTMSLTQSAHASDPGYGHWDFIQSAYQNGKGNHLTAIQDLSFQTIVELSQDGQNNTGSVHQGGAFGAGNFLQALRQVGDGNTGIVNMFGTYNGGNSLNSNSPAGASGWNFASSSGAQGSSMIQLGTGNGSDLLIGGNYNQFGVRQDGNQNFANGLNIAGNSNSLGIYQHGDGNVVALATISGDYNDVGLRQDGNDNVVGVTTTASDSRVWVKEQGNHNDVTAEQSGVWSVINTNIVGNYNLLNIKQDGGVGPVGNTMTVTISGDHNNDYGNTHLALSGDALTAKLAVEGELGSGAFVQGDLYQNGDDNTLTVLVTASNDNAFAMYQHGNGNTISHTITGGAGNQAVVAQIGSGNNSVTSQNGSFNVVGVTQ